MSRQGEYLPFVAVVVGSLLGGLPPPYGALCLFLFFSGAFLVFTGGLLLGWTRTRRLRREPPQRLLFKGPRVNLLVEKQKPFSWFKKEVPTQTRHEGDRLETVRWTLWTGLLRWLISELRPSLAPSALMETAQSCGFHLVAHKDPERCRLSASLLREGTGRKAGDLCATSRSEPVPPALIAGAVELVGLLLERLRKRQKAATLPDPPVRFGSIPNPSEAGAIVVRAWPDGVLDVTVVDQGGERWFLGHVKPRSRRAAGEAFHAAMAESGERRAH